MRLMLGIRREDKNKWEARVPLIPEHVRRLKEEHGIETIIQPSKIRVYIDDEFIKVGAIVNEEVSDCQVVFAVKEIPIDFFESGKTYVFFSHTIKGQKYNMPMLKKMMDLGCNLIDYERIVDERGYRLVFFGRFAGLAGMIDTLWSFGQRLRSKNIDTPLNEIKQTIHYTTLDDAKEHLKEVGEKIIKDGIHKSIIPLVVGFAGYGNVSKGAQEILDILPVKEISPKEIKDINDNPSDRCIYKVVFREEDMVEPILPDNPFELQDYYNHPEKYKGVFEKYVPDLTMLMNCIYWDIKYPRLITKEFIKKDYNVKYKLQVIGDISIDINGAIEFTEKATNSDTPSFIYNPKTNSIKDGVEGEGIVIMGVDNLPCELPRESSQVFSDTLFDFIPEVVKADFTKDFDQCRLPSAIKKAVILYHG
ncbi:MAG: bifunctional lysine ketoglutarate reductase /saccharopine dehydrogenase family protein, partial [Thermodesulfobacteriota bacterium]|nr:bifunctional lysine ketoglutarate reductase /saccharopine dehydrogenase family protein [Thermodesulfobacteriota bacterium]